MKRSTGGGWRICGWTWGIGVMAMVEAVSHARAEGTATNGAASRATNAAEAKWHFGPVTNGSCVAVEWKENEVFRGGQVHALRFRFRNEGTQTIALFSSEPRQSGTDFLRLTDAAGQTSSFSQGMCLGDFIANRIFLKPGEEAGLDGLAVAVLASPDDAAKVNNPCGYTVTAAPGNYTARFKLGFQYTWPTGEMPVDWHGDVETGPVDIVIRADTTATK